MISTLDKVRIHNIKYVNYHKMLRQKYQSPKNCENILRAEYMVKWKGKIINAYDEHQYSILGT